MLYRTTDKTEATEIVIIDSQMDYRGKLDTYLSHQPTSSPEHHSCYNIENRIGMISMKEVDSNETGCD